MQGTELIAQHEKMVHGLASRLRRELSLRGDLDDLIAFGFGGLLEAHHRFDPGRGVRFQTFAYYRIRGAMLDGVRKMADLPRRAHERLQAAAEVTPIAELDNRPIGRGSRGPITEQLQTDYFDLVHGRNDKYLNLLTFID